MDFNLYGWGRTKGFISKISEPKNLKELTKVSKNTKLIARGYGCLLYTSDAADE